MYVTGRRQLRVIEKSEDGQWLICRAGERRTLVGECSEFRAVRYTEGMQPRVVET